MNQSARVIFFPLLLNVSSKQIKYSKTIVSKLLEKHKGEMIYDDYELLFTLCIQQLKA